MKTKYMVFGSKTKCELYFDAKIDKRVADYKYLGNIISETTKISGDIFVNNYSYSCSKARSSVYAMECKLSRLGKLPSRMATYVFFATIEHILTYGTEVCGGKYKR